MSVNNLHFGPNVKTFKTAQRANQIESLSEESLRLLYQLSQSTLSESIHPADADADDDNDDDDDDDDNDDDDDIRTMRQSIRSVSSPCCLSVLSKKLDRELRVFACA